LAPEDADRAAARAALAAAFHPTRDLDIEKGLSHVGPHRDDVLFSLNDLPTKGYASHGETWSFALALKLAVAQIIRHGDLGDPILILDDVFAELDESRRNRLAVATRTFEQVLITAAVAADLPALGANKEFQVLAGVVS
jgi:DNA replication and repair protein RecF